jgi:hypothetical protein
LQHVFKKEPDFFENPPHERRDHETQQREKQYAKSRPDIRMSHVRDPRGLRAHQQQRNLIARNAADQRHEKTQRDFHQRVDSGLSHIYLSFRFKNSEKD